MFNLGNNWVVIIISITYPEEWQRYDTMGLISGMTQSYYWSGLNFE